LLCELGEIWHLRGNHAIADAVLSEALEAFTRAGAGRAATDAAARLSSRRPHDAQSENDSEQRAPL
jgi:hypothetical protein